MLRVGQQAQDFTLPAADDGTVDPHGLSEFTDQSTACSSSSSGIPGYSSEHPGASVTASNPPPRRRRERPLGADRHGLHFGHRLVDDFDGEVVALDDVGHRMTEDRPEAYRTPSKYSPRSNTNFNGHSGLARVR